MGFCEIIITMKKMVQPGKLILVIFTTMMVLVYLLTGRHYLERNFENNFKAFNKNNLEGVLTHVDIRYKGVGFKVDNNIHTYIFYPITDEKLNDGRIFNYFAEPGDSIYKPAYSDTLFLFKNGKAYRYTFQKPDEE